MKLLASWSPLDDIQKRFVESNAPIVAYTGGVAVGKTGSALMKALLLGTVVQKPDAAGVRHFRVLWVRATQSRLLSASIPSIKGWLGDAGKWTMGSPIFWRLKAPGIDFELVAVGLDDAEAVDRVMGSDFSIVAACDELSEIPDARAVVSRLLTRCGRFPEQHRGGITTGVRLVIISNKSAVSSDLHKLCVSERSSITEYFDAEQPILEDGSVNPKAPTRHLPPGYYENLSIALKSSPDVHAILLQNKWGLLSYGKPVIPEFKSTVHIANRKLIPSPNTKLRIAIDPGHFPACVCGALIETDQGNRWELYGELIGERVTTVKFAGMIREWMQREWPGMAIESAVIDPVAYQPSDREDEKLLAQVYEGILNLKIRPAAAPLWDVMVEAMRQPFNNLVGGVPAILLDPSMKITAEALAHRVCFKESQGALEKIISDNVLKPHSWGDAFAALGYLLSSTGYDDLRAFVRVKKKSGGGYLTGALCGLCGHYINKDTGQCGCNMAGRFGA